MSMNSSFGELLEAYYMDEGWWRVYKLHYNKLKHNYLAKRKVMKRFGHSRKQLFITELMRPREETLLGKIGREK